MASLYMGAGGIARDAIFSNFLQKMETDFVNPVSCERDFVRVIIEETENAKIVSATNSGRAGGSTDAAERNDSGGHGQSI